MAQQHNGPSTSFDFRWMQDRMLAERVSFRDLSKHTAISIMRLRRIAAGFINPLGTEVHAIRTALTRETRDE
jgi:hypothetical protein